MSTPIGPTGRARRPPRHRGACGDPPPPRGGYRSGWLHRRDQRIPHHWAPRRREGLERPHPLHRFLDAPGTPPAAGPRPRRGPIGHRGARDRRQSACASRPPGARCRDVQQHLAVERLLPELLRRDEPRAVPEPLVSRCGGAVLPDLATRDPSPARGSLAPSTGVDRTRDLGRLGCGTGRSGCS